MELVTRMTHETKQWLPHHQAVPLQRHEQLMMCTRGTRCSVETNHAKGSAFATESSWLKAEQKRSVWRWRTLLGPHASRVKLRGSNTFWTKWKSAESNNLPKRRVQMCRSGMVFDDMKMMQLKHGMELINLQLFNGWELHCFQLGSAWQLLLPWFGQFLLSCQALVFHVPVCQCMRLFFLC